MTTQPDKIGTSAGRWLPLLAVIIAGEAIFGLPFVVARVFRPTLLEVFQIDNTSLGLAFGVYGIVAMLAYFPGGLIADRFSPRKLMAGALTLTGLGGLWFVQIPSLAALSILYGFWGLSTIFLFWSPMIRVTRSIGGSGGQGKAFGVLDGGRGLLAATLAASTVAIFRAFSRRAMERATSKQNSCPPTSHLDVHGNDLLCSDTCVVRHSRHDRRIQREFQDGLFQVGALPSPPYGSRDASSSART